LNRWQCILSVWLYLTPCCVLGAEASVSKSPTSDAVVGSEQHRLRQREGTVLKNVEGIFKPTGDGATFEYVDKTIENNDKKTKCTALANLMLERVAQVLREMPDANEWVVSGEIYEFRGENYLLIKRAVLKTSTTVQATPTKRTPTRRTDERPSARSGETKPKSK
jgi:hypothetical protein